MNNLDNVSLTGYELRCDKCNAFLAYNEDTIRAHYDEAHAGAKSNWRKHTTFSNIETSMQRENNTNFVNRVTAQDIESDAELSFMSAELIGRARSFAEALGAKLYKFTSLADGRAHKIFDFGDGRQVDFDYVIPAEDRKRAARSMYNKDINLNHYLYSPYFNFVVDAEDVNGKLVALVLIEDPLFNELFDKELVTGNSVEYYRRNESCQCGTSCECVHTGVIYVGWALVASPAEPADANGEVVQRNFAEVTPNEHTRMLEQVQASAKANITSRHNNDAGIAPAHSYQRASENERNDNNETSSHESNTTSSSCACAKNSSATNSAQPDNSSANAEDNTSEQSEVVNEMTNEKTITLTETELNDRMAKVASAAVSALKSEFDTKFANTDKTIKELAASMPSGEALTKIIADTVNAATVASMKDLKADVLTLSTEFKTAKQAFTSSTGTQHASTLTKEDYAAMLPSKVAATSLSEIASLTESA